MIEIPINIPFTIYVLFTSTIMEDLGEENTYRQKNLNQDMNNTAEIKLQLLNINELLRLPVSFYLKSTLKTDAEEFIVEEAEALPRKAAINIKVHLALSEAKAQG